MIKIRVRKNKIIENIELYEPPEDKIGVILTINDSEGSSWKGKEWFDEFKKNEEVVYDSHDIRFAYIGMKVFIYLTSKKSIVADAVISSDENNEFLLTNLSLMGDPIHKDELIELNIIKTVPIVLKYLSKTDCEIIESLFED